MKSKKPNSLKASSEKSEVKEKRRLYKSRDDKIVDGVLGGIAEYFGVDSTLVRIIGVLMFLAQPGGFILFYIIASIIIPVKPLDEKGSSEVKSKAYDAKVSRNDGNMLFGGILVVLGVLFLSRNFFSWLRWDFMWPVLIIVIGIYMIVRR